MQKHQTNGRSMVEMLGVLAIIGVLAIGALAGLRYVLDKITVNRVVDEALAQATDIKTKTKKLDVPSEYYGSGFAYPGAGKYVHFVDRTYGDDGTVYLYTASVSSGVCKKLISNYSAGIGYVGNKGNKDSKENNIIDSVSVCTEKDCSSKSVDVGDCDKGEKTMVFAFGSVTTGNNKCGIPL